MIMLSVNHMLKKFCLWQYTIITKDSTMKIKPVKQLNFLNLIFF